MLPALLPLLLPLALLLMPAVTAQHAFPPLTGAHKVGTTALKVTDTSRIDPLAPTPHTPRSFILQFFYPTTNTTTAPLAPYMPPATAAFYEQTYNFPAGAFSTLQPHAHANASYAGPRTPGIVLVSPGLQASRHLYTALATDLASTGRVVLVADYPFETDIAVLPDGTPILTAFPQNHTFTDAEVLAIQATRVADTAYTLDCLRGLLRRALPGAGGVAPGRVAMVGHSLGGSTAAAAMAVDDRIGGGIAMDGRIWGDVLQTGIDGAFMFMGATEHYVRSYESWGMLWARLRGWRRELHLQGAAHLTFMDAAVVVEVLGMGAAAPEAAVGLVGTIDGLRATEVLGVYVRAFVDMVVGGAGRRAEEGRRMLAAPDGRFGEMEWVQ